MRHHSLLLALAATVGIAGPALADSGQRVVEEKAIILHNLQPSQVACKPADACKKDHCDDKDCKDKDSCDDKDCKEHHGKPAMDSCCAEDKKPAAGAKCDHASKADCKDKECKEHAKGHEACDDDGEEACEHGKTMVQREVREVRYSGGGMMGMHGMMGQPDKAYRLGYLWNNVNGRGYTMVGMDRLFGKDTCHTWWNPSMGPSCAYGMDLSDQTNTRHLGYAGWLTQNAMHFGPVTVTAGVMLGGGLNVDVTPTITFQNYNGFFVADPRVSVGWQVTPRMAVSLAGNYLLTTRPAAVGGPGAALQFSYGF